MKREYSINISGAWVFVVFLILKLTHTVDWSWLWITSPLWISLLLLLIGYIFMALLVAPFMLFVKNKIDKGEIKLTIKKEKPNE